MALALLAAGRSARMSGAHKLLRPYPEDPIVRRAAEAALASAVGPLAVVVGSARGPVAGALAGLPLTVLENPDAESGVSTSVRVALGWGLARAEALILLLADEPEMSPSVIRDVAARWIDRRPAGVRTRYRDRPGHPVLVTAELLARVGEPEGDRGLGSWLDDPGVASFPVDRDAPADIDTESAYLEALARLAH